MDELRTEIAHMIKLFDPEFGTYEELAARILALVQPHIDEQLETASAAAYYSGAMQSQ